MRYKVTVFARFNNDFDVHRSIHLQQMFDASRLKFFVEIRRGAGIFRSVFGDCLETILSNGLCFVAGNRLDETLNLCETIGRKLLDLFDQFLAFHLEKYNTLKNPDWLVIVISDEAVRFWINVSCN